MVNLYTVFSGKIRTTISCLCFIAFTMISANLFAEANYVYHEATTNNPGCGADNYRSVVTPNSSQSLTVTWKSEFQFFTDNLRLYYTTDGSTPSGAFGVPSGTTQVITGSYSCLAGTTDIAKATIPAQPAGTVVKYIVSAWHSGGGNEIFANGPGAPCGGCGTITNSAALATLFSYTVTASASIVEVYATGGTTYAAYSTVKGAFDAINLGTHTGAIRIAINGNTTETLTASLNASGGVVNYSSVKIFPTAVATVTGNIASAVIKLNGADNVTIDGRIGGAGNNLSVINSSLLGTTASIWLAGVGVGTGTINNVVRNLNISCGADQSTGTLSTYGIIMSGTTISTTANCEDCDNNQFLFNNITKVRYGITTRGLTTNLNSGIVISNNIIGPTAFGANEIGKIGIFLQGETGAVVNGNTIQFVGGAFANTTGGADRVGIAIGVESWSMTPGTYTSNSYTVTNNIIHDIIEERTFSAVGIILGTTGGGSATNNIVANNFIYNVKANGTAGDHCVGLGIAGGHTDKVVYNSIYMSGDVDPNPSATATSMFGSGIRVPNVNGTTHLNLTLKNNIVYMDLSSSSTPLARYYAISGSASTYSWGTGGENNNGYYINPSNPQLQTGGLGTASGVNLTTQFATLANWQTAYSVAQDGLSTGSLPNFVSSTDLHLQPSGNSAYESTGTPIVGVTTDIDGTTRNATTPDIGADEFVGLTGVDVGITALVTPASSGCYTATEAVSVTLKNYAVAAHDFAINPVTVTVTESTTGYNNNVIINTGTLAGFGTQTVSFVPTINMTSPGGYTFNANALVTGDINALNNAMAAANRNNLTLSGGTYTVGAAGTYLTLTSAVSVYNSSSCITGNIVFELLDATYPAETFPITINTNAAAGTNTLTIRPATGVTATISGSSANAIIKLFGADYITIDGSNSGGTDRSLTITNTNTAAATAAIWVSGFDVASGATNNTIKNCNLSCGSDQSAVTNSTFGIIQNGTVGIGIAFPQQDNDNNTFTNNFITKVRYGIVTAGESSANQNQNTVISNNLIGPSAFGTDQIGKAGILLINENNATVSGNEIRTVGVLSAHLATGTDRGGIVIGTDASWTPSSTPVSNTTITRNKIYNIVDEKTFSAVGIIVGSSSLPSNNIISNNMIYDIRANGTAGDQAVGIGISAGSGDKIVYNSIRITGDMDPGAITSSSVSAAGIRISSTTPSNLTLANNISYVDATSNTSTLKHYSVVAPLSYSFGSAFSNNNDFYVNAANTQMVLGGIGTSVPYSDRTTLASWQTSFTPTQDLNSIDTDPNFISATDLHINTATLSPVDNFGTAIAGVTSDYDGDTRSASTPDIGLDEMSSCANAIFYADNDGDTYGDPAVSILDCDGIAPAGYVGNNLDCNDVNAAINPDATEICDGLDNDCDGLTDDADPGITGQPVWFADTDGDGYGNSAVSQLACLQPVGYVADPSDCDDTNAAINIAAPEICDGLDNNCDGFIDEGLTYLDYYTDADGDGYGDSGATPVNSCSPVAGSVTNNTDCNDGNAAINPGATEVCNGIDDDCDGSTDDGLIFLNYYTDADSDGYGDSGATPVSSCSAVAGSVTDNTDCNDANASINPGATEVCDGVDQDCDGIADDGLTFITYYADADADTYGNAAVSTSTCDGPPAGYVLDATDCNDGNASINPGATEICNGIDDDCDGSTDDGLIFLNYYTDADGDGYGDSGATPVSSCSAVAGSVTDNTDCNDANASINPGATEVCDGVDQDCDGIADDGLTFTTYYADADGDTYGNAFVSSSTCDGPPAGYVLDATDCNDGNASINPGATEICNGIDDDCDGSTDDGLIFLNYYTDADGDGYGDSGATPVSSCSAVAGSVTDNTDCNDANASINPGATEVCDGVDQDCDGIADDGLTFTTYYADADGDTYGNAFVSSSTCDGPPAGYVLDATDCDDAESTVFPGGTEVCDGLDNDCDGDFDEGTVNAVVSPSGTVTVCKGDAVTLSTESCAGCTYQWFKNGNAIVGAISNSFITTKPANYQVQVTIPAGCFDLSAATTVGTIPAPNATVFAPNGTSLCTTVKLKAHYDPNYTFQWKIGGSNIGGATSYQYFPSVPGSYTCFVTNTVTGCTRTSPAINVTACKKGEELVATENMQLYPNPTENQFTIELSSNSTEQSAIIQLFNLVGEEVYASTASVNSGMINERILLSDNIPGGLYIVKITMGENEYTEQLVIQK